jgi:hypothetical protein
MPPDRGDHTMKDTMVPVEKNCILEHGAEEPRGPKTTLRMALLKDGMTRLQWCAAIVEAKLTPRDDPYAWRVTAHLIRNGYAKCKSLT